MVTFFLFFQRGRVEAILEGEGELRIRERGEGGDSHVPGAEQRGVRDL